MDFNEKEHLLHAFILQVYTVGPDYAHAEARKSPALDGKVERDEDGKEIRYPIILSAKEKLIARKVCLAFKVWMDNAIKIFDAGVEGDVSGA